MAQVVPLYIPEGILSLLRLRSPEDSTDKHRESMNERVLALRDSYKDEKFSLISWNEVDRAALHVGTVNHSFETASRDRMLSDLEVCDDIISVLEDLLSFTFSCEKLHKLIARIENYTAKLTQNTKAGFGDIIGVLLKWAEQGHPDAPSENDSVLLKIFVESKKQIPGIVPERHHKAFILDRLTRLEKIRVST
jgi:hypothetical protein